MTSIIAKISGHYQRYAKIKKLSKILDGLPPLGQRSGRIVIGNIRNNRFYIAVDYLLASIFSKMGFEAYILADDGQLSHHDTLRAPQPLTDFSPSQEAAGKLARYLIRRLLPNTPSENGVGYLYYSQVLKVYPVDTGVLMARLQQMESGEISKNVYASHRRYFGGRDFDPGNKQHRNYAKLSIRNEVISEQVAAYLLSEIKPDLYITLDGIYTTFGTLADAMKEQGIPVIMYQPDGFRDRSIRIGAEHAAIYGGGDNWHDFTTNHYTKTIRKEIMASMKNRLRPGEISLSPVEEDCINQIEKKRQDYPRVVALFPNLTWDGAIKERDTIFNGLGAWLRETVEWVKDKKILLVIREHPMPKHLYNTFESSLSLLKELLAGITEYDNVMLIEATVPVNSYKLIKTAVDCSVVYNGTLGAEIPFMGEPVVIAAKSPYRNKGVGYEPISKDEYFNLIATASHDTADFRSHRESIMENARRAAAYQFVYNCYYCPIMPTLKAFHSSNRYWQDWDLTPESIDPSCNPKWHKTIERFLEPLTGEKTGQ